MTTNGTWVIKRSHDRRYVALAGSTKSYTRNVREARRFRTREAAERDLCVDNEYVLRIDVG